MFSAKAVLERSVGGAMARSAHAFSDVTRLRWSWLLGLGAENSTPIASARLHRTRHLFIRQQTAVINSIRAHLAFLLTRPLWPPPRRSTRLWFHHRQTNRHSIS